MFASSDRVASAVCQRYIAEILSNSLSPNALLQRIAVDILSSVARSGFGHPLSISPTLVALNSAPDLSIGQKAYSMLTLLHQKHASLLATRFMEHARTSYEYARAMASSKINQEGGAEEMARGYNNDEVPVSNFGKWYKSVILSLPFHIAKFGLMRID